MKRVWLPFILSIVCILAASQVLAVTFAPPVEYPEQGYCYIQNYVDVSPIRGGQDPYKHTRSYDRHRGTDFRVSFNAMMNGVPVLAAAGGKVLRTRDGMEDAYILSMAKDVEGHECGNGVVIDHGDGWRSQYCHLKKGSVIVEPGDEIEAGAVLGMIGLSGKTEFSHLHFQVSKDGEIVCPFSGAKQGKAFAHGASASEPVEVGEPLWEDVMADVLQYVPAQLLRVDYSSILPNSSRDVLRRPPAPEILKVTNQPIIFSAVTTMLQKGDVLTVKLADLGGNELAKKIVDVKNFTAQRYDYVGRKDSHKYKGKTLEGVVELVRGGLQIFQHRSLVVVK